MLYNLWECLVHLNVKVAFYIQCIAYQCSSSVPNIVNKLSLDSTRLIKTYVWRFANSTNREAFTAMRNIIWQRVPSFPSWKWVIVSTQYCLKYLVYWQSMAQNTLSAIILLEPIVERCFISIVRNVYRG